jgi:HEPN domain-containing protein
MSDRLDEIKQWIIKGDHDLGTAKITFLHIPEYLDTVTFHCQQAVEKYLKAFLVYLSKPFRFSHDLVYLLDLISEIDPDFAKYYDSISELQGYAVEIRYPDETIFLSPENVKQAISIAKHVRDFVTKKMDIAIDYNSIIDN